MNLLVGIYALTVLVQVSWQFGFGAISIEQTVSALFVYLAPLSFYVYFRKLASDKEIRTTLIAIVFIGLMTGVFFIFESYGKLVLGVVGQYAQDAFAYSADRRGLPPEALNPMRVTAGARSVGLLETHAVSAAWVAMGGFAALAITNRRARWKRIFIITASGAVLTMGLNITSIAAFVVTLAFIEYRVGAWLGGRFSSQAIRSLAVQSFVILGLVFVLWLWLGGPDENPLIRAIRSLVVPRIILVLGVGSVSEGQTWFNSLLTALPDRIRDYPWGAIVGEGFSVFGSPKGGDTGFAESIWRFGIPASAVILVGLVASTRRASKMLSQRSTELAYETGYLWFATCLVLYVLIAEVHYSVWNAKSILPLFFMALAIYGRHLVPLNRRVDNRLVAPAPARHVTPLPPD